MIALLLLLLAAGFIAYAVYANYGQTDPGDPVPKRVWAAIIAALGAAATALLAWLQGLSVS